jgi:hypothetical protein
MRFYWRDGAWRDREGNPMPIPEREGLCMPTIRSDIEDYASPIDGKRISSRSGQRYDLAKNDCVLAPPSKNKFNPEEYRHRKAEQAKAFERRRAGLI